MSLVLQETLVNCRQILEALLPHKCRRQVVNALADWRESKQYRQGNNISFCLGSLFYWIPCPLFLSLPAKSFLYCLEDGKTQVGGKEEANFSVRPFNASDMTDGFGGSYNHFFLNHVGYHMVHRHNWKWRLTQEGCFQSALSVHRLWKVQTVCRAMEQPCSLGIEPYFLKQCMQWCAHSHTHAHRSPF